MRPIDNPLVNIKGVDDLGVTMQQLAESQLPVLQSQGTLNNTLQELITAITGRQLPGPPPAPTTSAEGKATSGMVQYNVTVAEGAFKLDARAQPTQQVDSFLKALRLKAHTKTGDSNRIRDL